MKTLTFILLIFIGISSTAQNRYLTKVGTLSFEASVPSFEEVSATNNAVTAIINTENGEFAALALVKAFRFKNALMEEHFNENYAESDDYPKATFNGKIDAFYFSNLNELDTQLQIDGSLMFHGVTKDLKSVPLLIKIVDNKIIISGSFKVMVSDFNIEIPKIVKNKLSDEVSVTFEFELMKK